MGALLLLLTFLAYQSAWFGQPVWDDDAHLTPPDLRSLAGLGRIWVEPGATQQYYPLTFSAFWLQCQLWGDRTLGYHVVNILLHGLCALLLFRILVRLQIPGAWLAAFLFALHPVHVESVAWMTELKNVLSGAFFLGSALLFLGFAENRTLTRYWLSLALFVLGLLTKTAIAPLPAALLVILWWKRGGLSWKRDILPLLPFFLVGLSAGVVTASLEQGVFGAKGEQFRLSLIERCLVAGRSTWFHLGKLCWPADLAFMYTRWPVSQAVWWQYLFPGTLVLLLGGAWAARRRSRAPLAALLFFGGMLFPALGFFNAYSFLYSFVNDHHQYLASAGVLALAASAATLLLARARVPGTAAVALLVTLLLALGSMTWRRAGAFRDDETLWRDTLAKSPDCWMAHHNWAHDLAAQGNFEAAAEHYRAALALNADAEAHLGFGAVLDALGKEDEALREYQAAVQANPNYAEAHNNLSQLYLKHGQLPLALQHAREALRLNANYPEAHYNLGNVFNLQGKTAEAAAEYAVAVRLRPRYAQARYNLGGARLRLGDAEGAANEFLTVLQIQPGNPVAFSKLAFVRVQQGRLAEAIDFYAEAIRLQPDLVEALRNLSFLRATCPDARYRNGAEALQLAEEAVRLTGRQDATALDALAAAYAENGRFTEAAATALQAKAVAAAQHNPFLANQVQQRLDLYKLGQPYRQ